VALLQEGSKFLVALATLDMRHSTFAGAPTFCMCSMLPLRSFLDAPLFGHSNYL
jgi:hypothetical protein